MRISIENASGQGPLLFAENTRPGIVKIAITAELLEHIVKTCVSMGDRPYLVIDPTLEAGIRLIHLPR
jgi:hypothetical protein